jgi:hypothetical protein
VRDAFCETIAPCYRECLKEYDTRT